MEKHTKVLVVEDDSGIRQSLFETLGALGFAVGEASTGEEALQRLRMVDYDVVLLDINMPGMGGMETCRRIAQQDPGLPIVVLTVRDEESDKVDADTGADGAAAVGGAAVEGGRAADGRDPDGWRRGARSRAAAGGEAGRGDPPDTEGVRDAAVPDGAGGAAGAASAAADDDLGTGVWE
jgi:CheY-like chemotaxis protein